MLHNSAGQLENSREGGQVADSLLFIVQNFAEDLFDSGTRHSIIVLSRLCDSCDQIQYNLALNIT